MLEPYDALDLLDDPVALAEWADVQGMAPREAYRVLNDLAEPLFADGAPPLESRMLRHARAVHASRGRLAAGRTDVEELCAFVERAGALPSRVKEVFGLCVVQGLSHRECAARIGIAPATVRVHLRRLRRIMRACGEGSVGELPGVARGEPPSRSDNPG